MFAVFLCCYIFRNRKFLRPFSKLLLSWLGSCPGSALPFTLSHSQLLFNLLVSLSIALAPASRFLVFIFSVSCIFYISICSSCFLSLSTYYVRVTTESRLNCFEISSAKEISLILFCLASREILGQEKQPHSLPKYHKNGLYPMKPLGLGFHSQHSSQSSKILQG